MGGGHIEEGGMESGKEKKKENGDREETQRFGYSSV